MGTRTRALERLGIVCLLAAGCASAPPITPDVVYGHKEGMALIYDVIRPEHPNGAGVLAMVSGGWVSVWRPPEERLPPFRPLLDEGFTVFTVMHGSAPCFKVPDAVSDVRAAVRHIRAHAAEYGVDPERLGVWGGSAGGQLALMLGLDPETPFAPPVGKAPRSLGPYYEAKASDAASLAAVVAYFPAVDLRPMAGSGDFLAALDFPVAEAAAVSPILFVSADDPPTLLVHGDADELVSIRNSEELNAALEAKGVDHDFLVIHGAGHGFRGEQKDQADAAMVRWFKRYLVERPPGGH